MALNFLNNGYFAGKVGIGIETPGGNLHVVGDTGSSGQIYLSDRDNGTGTGDALLINKSGTSAFIYNRDGGQLSFGTNNVSNNLVIANTGNVGIGTASPGVKLEVASSSNPSIKIQDTTDGYAQKNSLIFDQKIVAAQTEVAKIYTELFNGATTTLNNPLKFATAQRSTLTMTDRMVIDNLGNVGIGTTSPSGLLHVSSGTSGDAVVIIESDTDNDNENDNPQLQFKQDGGNTIAKIGLSGDAGTIFTNSLANTAYFGNDEAASVQLYTNATARLTIESGGDVGIGTTNPGYKLDVNGSVNTAFGATNGYRINTNRVLSQVSGGVEIGVLDYKTIYPNISFNNDNTFKVQQNGSTRIIVNSSGNVGIGTTSPAALLHLQSTGSPSIRIQDSDGTNQYATINHNNGDNQYIARNNTANGSHVFYGQTGVSSFNERMRITSAGNVGIGTTSPTDKLDVNGRTTSKAFRTYTTNTDYNLLSRSSGGNAALYVQSATSDTNQAIAQFNYGSATANAGQKVLLVAKDNSYFLNTNVGIGTTSPGYKLEVTGNARVSSNFYIGNVDAVTTATEVLVRQSDRVRGITPANLINASGGPYLPLTGSVYNGGTATWSNGITGDLALVSTSGTKGIIIGDEDNGSGQLFVQFNSSNGSGILNNNGGNLEITAQNYGNGSDITFRGNDTNNNLVTYFQTVGASQKVRVVDNIKLTIGTSDDLQIYSDGVSSNIIDSFNMSQMLFRQHFLNGDMTFQSDDGTGGVTTYFKLDGGNERLQVDAPNGMLFPDNIIAKFGTSADLQIYHDSTNSYSAVVDVGTGYLLLGTDGPFVLIGNSTATETYIKANNNSSVELYYDNTKKLETGIVSVGTATTAGGTLIDGWITTTQANAVNNTTIATTAYVNNKIALIPAGLVFQGTWNAATNTPTLTSGSGTTGNFYIVSTPGSTNLDGITDWKVGDWAVFIEQGASDQWEKIDNSSVLDGIGTGQTLPLWSGSGTSNTLTNSHITQNTALANDIIIPQYIRHTGDTNTLFGFSQANNFIINTNNTNALTINSAQNATFGNDISLGGNLTLTTNARYLRAEDNAGTTTRLLGINGSNNTYIGPIDTYAGGSIFYGVSANVSSHTLYTGASARLHINSSGNVGIGTTNPGLKLDINSGTANSALRVLSTDRYTGIKFEDDTNNDTLFYDGQSDLMYLGSTNFRAVDIHATGNLRVEGAIYDSNNSPGTANQVLVSTVTGTDWIDGSAIPGVPAGSGTVNYLARWTPDVNTLATGVTYDNGTNVGILTTNPLDRLQVSGVISATANDTAYSNGYFAKLSSDYGPNALKLTSRTGDILRASNYGSSVSILTGNPTSVKMFIDSSGNVGIGTTSPSHKLTVNAPNNTTAVGIDFPSAHFDFSANSTSGYTTSFHMDDVGMDIGHNSAARSLNLKTGNLDRVTILGNGNVGIGTTSPLGTLHVAKDSQVYSVSSSYGLYVTGKTDQTNALGLGYDDTNDVAYLQSVDIGVSFNDLAINPNGGNVGIGTASPGHLFHVYAGDGVAVNSYTALVQNAEATAGDNFGLKVQAGKNSSDVTMEVSNASGSSYIRVRGDGNVGIGTTNPGTKLHISGNSALNDTSTQSLLRLERPFNSGVSFAQGGDIAIGRGTTYPSTQMRFILDNGTNNPANPQATIMALDSSGNVGIGTTSPGTKLQVGTGSGATVDTAYQIVADGSAISGIQILSGTTQSGRLVFGDSGNNDIGIIKYDHSNNSLQTIVNAAERMRITSAGNVGVGVTAPDAKLHIADTNKAINSEGNLFVATTDNYAIDKGGQISLGGVWHDTPLTAEFAAIAGRKQTAVNGNAGGYLQLSTSNSSGGNLTEKMRITQDGKVGIGTTSPGTKLHVSGGIITVNDGTGITYYEGVRINSYDTNGYDIIGREGLTLSTVSANKNIILSPSGNVGIGTTGPQSKLQVAGGIQMADDTATASATKVGTMRYRTGTEYVDVTGAELVVNGSFATDTNWNKNANWTISGGTANADGTSNADINQADNLPTAGSIYRVIFEITAITQGQVRIEYGDTVTDFLSALGKYEYILTAASTDRIRVQCQSSFIGSIDNISIVEVTAEDASYADMCMQTGSSTYEWVNIVRNTY